MVDFYNQSINQGNYYSRKLNFLIYFAENHNNHFYVDDMQSLETKFCSKTIDYMDYILISLQTITTCGRSAISPRILCLNNKQN